MRLGYARVSTGGQDLGLQLAALRDARVDRIFEETASGGRWDRPELHRLLDQIRPGDEVVVWKLDRLSRSLRDLLLFIERVEAKGASFRSLTEAIETASPAGRMLVQMLGAVAEFERAILRERTRAGLEVARAAGRVGGGRRKLGPAQRATAIEMVEHGKTAAEVARIFGVHRGTIGRLTRSAGLSPGQAVSHDAAAPGSGGRPEL